MKDTDSEFLTPKEVAGMLKVSIPTLNRWRSQGIAPQEISINGKPRWVRQTVQQWVIDQNPQMQQNNSSKQLDQAITAAIGA